MVYFCEALISPTLIKIKNQSDLDADISLHSRFISYPLLSQALLLSNER
jgi:hypothetical protein